MTIIALYIFFLVSGKIENMIFTVKNYKGKHIDYHGLRAIVHLSIFIGLIFHDATITQIVGHSMIANLLYEMVLKGTWDIRTDRKTFNIFNMNIFYRWWFYPAVAVIGFAILVIDSII